MWSDAVAVHPWVGNLYPSPLHFKYRTLIVGESNYTTPEKYKSSLVIDCVLDDMSASGDRDTTGFCRFSTKLRRIIWGRHEPFGPSGLWHDVAFYNFVQPLVGDRARMRPTDEMWNGSVSAFAEVVQSLNPARVLVLGKANWENLLRSLPHKKIGPCVAELEVTSTNFRAGFINHPSSSLSYSTWHPIAQAFLFT
jgi:hypothetical protein